ncbi:MAG: hypothetical protein Ct9H300mP3_09050 [Gammaproteobacteria bacterium]|nr:MAG: hypothetical protein Ct9H300mP3_09050 [Gammaproteobacteria bacterium]
MGLNPHAGDGGYLGKEDQEIIAPAIEYLKAKGLNLIGPVSADTAFVKKKSEQIDAYLAMYHDQGLPVLKTAGFLGILLMLLWGYHSLELQLIRDSL